MSDFDFANATVQEKLDERDRRDECRRRGLSLTGPDTLPPTWRKPPIVMIDEAAELTPKQLQDMMHPGAIIPTSVKHVAYAVELGARKITLPWTNICRDNERLTPIVRRGKPSQVTSEKYGDAKKRARETAKSQLGFQIPLDGPLSFSAVLYEPNRHRRDLGNYVKMVADSLTGLAYDDDSQISELLWKRGGVDIDAPRLEITIRQLFDPHRST